MRNNQPVTQQEYRLGADDILMSTTDVDSYIRYANTAFVEASGYTEDELRGQPHNIVRHPDMPAPAFADMWGTLAKGRPWTGLVKNRRKDGDHYWVRANAAPVINGKETTGYVSVRTTPSQQEIEQAESLYASMRAGKVRWRKLHQGILVFRGPLAFLSINKRMPVRGRIGLSFILQMMVWSALWFGTATHMLPFSAVTGIALACTASLIIALILDHQITKPIHAILQAVSDVAAGKKASAAPLNRVDELGMIMRCVNQSGLNLRSLVADVNAQIDCMSQATDDLSKGSETLNDRSLQNAASLQQTASAITQMTESLERNAANANQVASLSENAARGTDAGTTLVSEVVTMMDKIQESSQQINDIVELIDSIAFQTNLLALNAAVEAARAGEAGKGFAVVASEVRTLSERSAEAASQVRELISSSTKEVDEGTKVANHAGSSMQSLNEQMTELSILIKEISVAVTEQSAAVGEINTEVNNLDSATNSNAALVDRTTEAVTQLHSRTRRLYQAIALYNDNKAA